MWRGRRRQCGAKLIRYCDDYVILCRGNPQPWFQRMERIVHDLGLSLNAEKTRIVDAKDGFRLPRDALPAAADEGQSEATVLLSVASHEGDAERAPEGS